MDTHTATRPETGACGQLEEATQTPRPATLTALLQARPSGYSREFLRASVLAWAARNGPDLFIGRNACEPAFESRSGVSRVQVASACHGNYTWSFKGNRPDATGRRFWETRVLVVGDDAHDLFGVSTGYLGDAGRAATVAQPAFLGGLIEHLPFEDGGYPV